MKYSPTMVANAEAWVRENGLFPDPCGAKIKDFCDYLGIDDDTYYDWLGKPEFSEALKRAREYFKTNTVQEVSNALIKAAKGVDFTAINEEARSQKIKERDPKTGKVIREYDGPAVIVKSSRKTIYYPPNVEAAKFVLTNLAPDSWKNKQEATVHTPDAPMSITVGSQEAADALKRVLDSGAQPRDPGTPDE